MSPVPMTQHLVSVLLHALDKLLCHVLQRGGVHKVGVVFQVFLHQRRALAGGGNHHRHLGAAEQDVVKGDVRGVQRGDNVPGHGVLAVCDAHVLHILVKHVAGVVRLGVHGAGAQHDAIGDGPEHIQDEPVRVGPGGVILVLLGNEGPLGGICKAMRPSMEVTREV